MSGTENTGRSAVLQVSEVGGAPVVPGVWSKGVWSVELQRPWRVALEPGRGLGCSLRLDPWAPDPVATWLVGQRGLPLARLEQIGAVVAGLLADLREGRILRGAFAPEVFRPLFVAGPLHERPRVRRPHVASLEVLPVDVADGAAYAALCAEVVLETRRLPVPGGGALTVFHVVVPVVEEPTPAILETEARVLRHELLHAFAAQVLGFRGNDAGRGLDPLCVSAERAGDAPGGPGWAADGGRAGDASRSTGGHGFGDRAGDAVSAADHAGAAPRPGDVATGQALSAEPAEGPARAALWEREAGHELRRRVARAVSAVTDPHERLRVVQRIAAAFVEHWERNPGPVRPSAWRRILGSGGESVEAWCAAQPQPSSAQERAARTSLTLAAAESCVPGWARVAGPCEARAEVVYEAGRSLLVLRATDATPGSVDADAWLAMAKAGRPFEAHVQATRANRNLTLRDVWASWCIERRAVCPHAVDVVAVGLDGEEASVWNAAAAELTWLDVRLRQVESVHDAPAAVGTGAHLVVAGGALALDHVAVASLWRLASEVPIERLLLRGVEVEGVMERVDGRGLYADLTDLRLAVPSFEPWLRWSAPSVRAMDPRFRVEGWVPGVASSSHLSPEQKLAGAARYHAQRVAPAGGHR